MNKKDLLFEDWKEAVENVRFYRDQINKMSVWEFGLFPAVGIAIATKFIFDFQFLYAGITFIILTIILGYIDNLAHLNARYSLINILIAQDIEKELGTSVVSRVRKYYLERLEKDKKNPLAIINIKLFGTNSISVLKYLIFDIGLILILISQLI